MTNDDSTPGATIPDAAQPAPNDPRRTMADSILQLILHTTNADPDTVIKRRHTSRGTPCARSWDDDWLATVEAAEQRLDRRICGARTRAAVPCELDPNHTNGRCRFHGGFALTGAQKANRNAVIHGLYSRSIRICGPSCPLWSACPCAGADLEALPEAQLPSCPYEQSEYNSLLTGALDRVSRNPDRDALDLNLAHHVAILGVMTNRAAIALRNEPLVDQTTVAAKNYQSSSRKVSPSLDAFTRLSREYRRCAAELKAAKPEEPPIEDFLNHHTRISADTSLDPDLDALLHPATLSDGADQARRYLRRAEKCAAEGHDAAAIQAAFNADALQSHASEDWIDRIVGAYRPRGKTLAEDSFKKIIQKLLGKDAYEDPLERYTPKLRPEFRFTEPPGDQGHDPYGHNSG